MHQSVQVYRQISEVVQRPRWEKIVDVWKRSLQSARQRRIIDGADQRIQPDQTVTAAAQPGDLIAQHHWVAAIPAVGDEQHDGTAMEDPARPSAMKLHQ